MWRASSSVCVARKRLLASSGAALISPDDAASAQTLADHELHRRADAVLAQHGVLDQDVGLALVGRVAVLGVHEVALRRGFEPALDGVGGEKVSHRRPPFGTSKRACGARGATHATCHHPVKTVKRRTDRSDGRRRTSKRRRFRRALPDSGIDGGARSQRWESSRASLDEPSSRRRSRRR
jgi:hypothetical protein